MENVYTSVGVNRACTCLVISKEGLVYFGANASVAVYSPKEQRILKTLVQFSKKVNCLSLAEGPNHPHSDQTAANVVEIIAGSTSGEVAVWRRWEQSGDEHALVAQFTAHVGPVTCVAVVASPCDNTKLTVVTTGNDSKVYVWCLSRTVDVSEQKVEKLAAYDMKTGLVFTLHVVAWPTSFATLFCAGDDCMISIVRLDTDQDLITNQQETKQQNDWNVLERLRGHDDWITSINSIEISGGLLVASASHDSTIRLWRVQPYDSAPTFGSSGVEQLQVDDVVFDYPDGKQFSVQLESVLCGHDDKVFSVSWNIAQTGQLSLLSASLDKTMIVWREEVQEENLEEGDSQVWVEHTRVGEVGGNTLGLLGAAWGPNSDILGYSFSGALHAWVPTVDNGGWSPAPVVSGHQGPVVDLSWEIGGAYLLTTGADQTTRCHAPCSGSNTIDGSAWHEVARPQVHGYDMSCLAALPECRFVSGAEEKVLRAFQAPKNFLDNFHRLTGRKVLGVQSDLLPQGASLPTLGLSNKAVFDGEKAVPEEERHVKDQFPDFYFQPQLLDGPPCEEALVQNTLWPEQHKMYGHGYELYCVACSHDGRMVASACKSSRPQEAAILIWDTKTWKQIGRIEAHGLTVTQLAFSPVTTQLLSVSRDRTWALHQLGLESPSSASGGQLSVRRLAHSDKKTSPHKRLIWACCWSPCGGHFYTASRDRLVVAWSAPGGTLLADPLVLPDSVTSLAAGRFASNDQEENCPHRLAVGLENGQILLFHSRIADDKRRSHELVGTVDTEAAHHLTVKRLAFCPGQPSLLASCSLDHTVKIYNVSAL